MADICKKSSTAARRGHMEVVDSDEEEVMETSKPATGEGAKSGRSSPSAQVTTATKQHDPVLAAPTPEQSSRWKSGIQAVFAGFVAAAKSSGIEPDIETFWKATEQRDMISPSLQSLCKCPINRDNQPSQGNDEEERLRTLQMELYNVLVDPSNILTKRLQMDTTQDTPDDTARVQWQLTKAARYKLVSLPITLTPGQTPVSTAPPSPTLESPGWWNL